jgi:hypothetical protein
MEAPPAGLVLDRGSLALGSAAAERRRKQDLEGRPLRSRRRREMAALKLGQRSRQGQADKAGHFPASGPPNRERVRARVVGDENRGGSPRRGVSGQGARRSASARLLGDGGTRLCNSAPSSLSRERRSTSSTEGRDVPPRIDESSSSCSTSRLWAPTLHGGKRLFPSGPRRS